MKMKDRFSKDNKKKEHEVTRWKTYRSSRKKRKRASDEDERERESLVSRSVTSIRDSLGPISKELLRRLISSRTLAFFVRSRSVRCWTDVRERRGTLLLARVRRNSSRSRCSLICFLSREEQGIEATN